MYRSSQRTLKSVLAVLAIVAVSACGSRETPLSQVAPEDLWLQGIEAYNAEQWSDAIRYFERFAMVGGADARVHQARYYVAEARFNLEEYVTAATLFSALASDLGRHDMAAQARFMACRSYEELAPNPQLDQEYTRAAIDHCQSLVDFFPDSEYAPEAQRIVGEMWDRLAAKTFVGGDWYQKRRAYDSALIYFEDVVRLYPRTSYAPRALRRMIDIYEILEYDQELEETRARLLADYPDSPEARRLADDGGDGGDAGDEG